MGRPEMHVEAELRVPAATIQLVNFVFFDPISAPMRQVENYRLDLCLPPRPRNARVCDCDRWSPPRYERLGPVWLVPPHEQLQTCSEGNKRQRSLVCHLPSEQMRQWLQGDMEWTDRRLSAILDIPDANVRGLLLRLA